MTSNLAAYAVRILNPAIKPRLLTSLDASVMIVELGRLDQQVLPPMAGSRC